MKFAFLLLIFINLIFIIIGCTTTVKRAEPIMDGKKTPEVLQKSVYPTYALDTVSMGTIRLRWRTESEIENFGFNLYRSLSPDGPWEKVNAKIIPGHGTTSEPKEYRYVDTGVRKNTLYYYQLEEIDLAGNAKRLPHIIRGKDTTPVEPVEN